MKENLGFGSLGNGGTVWDRNRQESGDTKVVALINRDRSISFYDKELSVGAKKKIREFAKKNNIRLSVTQPEFVMLKPLGVPERVLEEMKKKYSKIAGEELRVMVTRYSDDIYAFGSELACLKLAKHFAGKELRLKHSNGATWMFVIFDNLK